MIEEILRTRTRNRAKELLFPRQYQEELKRKELEREIREQPHVKALMELSADSVRN